MEQGQRVIQTGAEPSGPLRVGSPESILTYRLPPILRTFRQRFPHVELSFRPHLNETLVAELETGKLDMVICMSDAMSSATLVSAPLRTEKILLLAHASHPLARKPAVQASDLAGQTLLLTETGLRLPQQTRPHLALAERSSRQHYRIFQRGSAEAVRRRGHGHRTLPAIVVARELRQRQFKACTGRVRLSTLTPTSCGTKTNGYLRRWPRSATWCRALSPTRPCKPEFSPRSLTCSQRARYRRCPHRHPIDAGKSAWGSHGSHGRTPALRH